ncbi:zinc metallopeptidase [Anaerofustis stercorihominis]|uniref:Neutral zinc metallopeptidase n=1 Tax=Anaerofustis stercorihominis DSM 17244 TaxID=445971 RepID=B1C5S3_9FIRM|nr:zinc metallopeptidase [Anaerofustis stercorihominis]EDS73637.1 putative neutral zinc metallopeptidase [Anaerofustis stercorihominis DSM 17244]MCQ4794699.1 zinc metallopeptidase [Anaerofustis stercorihominis]
MFYYYYGEYWILLPAILLTLYASFKVNSTFRKYSKVENSRGMTGYDCARKILDSNGLSDVEIQRVEGSMTDHYDPRSRVLRLSDTVFNVDSIAAVSVAAHECGHAIQHQQSYKPLIIRNTIVPAVSLASSFSWVLILLGLFFSFSNLITVGIIFFAATVVFQLITLPVEFNASSRALRIISDMGIVYGGEEKAAKKVLSAAALTYVAAALTSILQLLRLILISRDN